MVFLSKQQIALLLPLIPYHWFWLKFQTAGKGAWKLVPSALSFPVAGLTDVCSGTLDFFSSPVILDDYWMTWTYFPFDLSPPPPLCLLRALFLL